jgi:hypothetical protein
MEELEEKPVESKWTRALLDSLCLPSELTAGETITPEWLKRAEVNEIRAAQPWSGNIYAYNSPNTPGSPSVPPIFQPN